MMRSLGSNISVVKLARITGLFYLLIILGGLFGGAVRESIVDPADASATLQNLIAQESFYRAGFAGDLLMVICDVMVSVLFLVLLYQVHKGIAMLATLFRLMQAAVLGANLINLFQPVLMIQGHGAPDAKQTSTLASDVWLQLQVFEHGYLISGVFFAINCLLMGYLLYRAVMFPGVLGIMIGLAGFGYMFNSFSSFLAPSLISISEMIMLFTAVISEVALCLYLIIRGVRTTEQNPEFAQAGN